jgi:hypothetical protein
MDVFIALKYILSKMMNLCPTVSPWIQGTCSLLLLVTEEVKEHFQTSIFVKFLHEFWYLIYTHSNLSQLYKQSVSTVFTHHSTAVDSKHVFLVFQNLSHHLRSVRMFMICQDKMCNHSDGYYQTFEISSPSPYIMQSQHTILKHQHY